MGRAAASQPDPERRRRPLAGAHAGRPHDRVRQRPRRRRCDLDDDGHGKAAAPHRRPVPRGDAWTSSRGIRRAVRWLFRLLRPAGATELRLVARTGGPSKSPSTGRRPLGLARARRPDRRRQLIGAGSRSWTARDESCGATAACSRCRRRGVSSPSSGTRSAGGGTRSTCTRGRGGGGRSCARRPQPGAPTDACWPTSAATVSGCCPRAGGRAGSSAGASTQPASPGRPTAATSSTDRRRRCSCDPGRVRGGRGSTSCRRPGPATARIAVAQGRRLVLARPLAARPSAVVDRSRADACWAGFASRHVAPARAPALRAHARWPERRRSLDGLADAGGTSPPRRHRVDLGVRTRVVAQR